MKTILVVISCCLAVMTACVGVAVFQARDQARTSQRLAANIGEELRNVAAQLEKVQLDKSKIEESFQAQTAETKVLQEQLAARQREEPAPNVEPIQPPRPFRVQTYLGREPLGDAWLVPRNFVQDPDTGRASYEPVIVLDEKLKEKFTLRLYETNYVAEPVETTVNYNYTPPYSYYYPVYYGVSDRPGHRPRPRSRIVRRPAPAFHRDLRPAAMGVRGARFSFLHRLVRLNPAQSLFLPQPGRYKTASANWFVMRAFLPADVLVKLGTVKKIA